jgi:hypothetical protein
MVQHNSQGRTAIGGEWRGDSDAGEETPTGLQQCYSPKGSHGTVLYSWYRYSRSFDNLTNIKSPPPPDKYR